jgi:hypothetical protein
MSHRYTVQHIPSWFPGASFKRTAILSAKYAEDMIEAPFQFVEKNMVGSSIPYSHSFISSEVN